jgi:hypothetical protein
MRVLEPGHQYEVTDYDLQLGDYPTQHLFFMKRIGARYPGNQGGPHAGTNLQEVFRVCIDRMKYLNNQIPCAETEAAIHLVETALLLMEIRAKRVKSRALFLSTIAQAVSTKTCPTCATCGHILCEEEHK